MKRWSIQRRLLFLAVVPAAIATAGLSGFFLTGRIDDLDRGMQERGRAIVRQLAPMSEFGVYAGNRALLQRIADSTRQEPDVAAVLIRGPRGEVLVRSPADARIRPARQTLGGLLIHLEDGGRRAVFEAPIQQAQTELEEFLGEGSPKSPVQLGSVVVEFDREPLLRLKQQLVAGGVFAGLLLVGLMALLAERMSRQISGPLLRLIEAVRRLGRGELEVRVDASSGGSIGELERGVNAMAESLQAGRDNLQAMVRSATSELEQQKEQAVRANRAKTRFLAAASHDLRQPMHAMSLLVSALQTAADTPRTREISTRIEASVKAMGELLDALLDVSRLDAGSVPVHPVEFPVGVLLERVCAEFAEDARSKDLCLRTPRTTLWTRSDPLLVERIVRNLVANAVRYTREGGVVVGCRRHNGQVRIEVWDSGVGIPEKNLDEIFQEFVQLDNPERDRGKGLGLGLAIVQRLARLLGQRVGVRSREGEGSVFSVSLPRCAPKPASVYAPQSVPAAPEALRGSLVMLVDDDALVRDAMATALAGWGCYVVCAGSGAAAVAQLDELEREPDVIVCDYRLPGGETGFEVLAALRRQLSTEPGIIVVSGDTSPDVMAEAREAGFLLLHKPVRPEELQGLLLSLLPAG